MRIIDTAQVLARIQAFNNRTVDEAVITSWHEILEPFELSDCMRAVTDHFRYSKDWVMPIDITRRVHEFQADRIHAFKDGLHLTQADELAAADSGTWREATRNLHRLAASGHLTPAMYDDYQAGNIQLNNIIRKEVAR